MLHNSPFYNKYSKITFYIKEYSRMQLIIGYDQVPYLFNGYTLAVKKNYTLNLHYKCISRILRLKISIYSVAN